VITAAEVVSADVGAFFVSAASAAWMAVRAVEAFRVRPGRLRDRSVNTSVTGFGLLVAALCLDSASSPYDQEVAMAEFIIAVAAVLILLAIGIRYLPGRASRRDKQRREDR
jgi:hypothetical protein